MSGYFSKPVRAEDLSAALDSSPTRPDGAAAFSPFVRVTDGAPGVSAPLAPAIDEASLLLMVGGDRPLLAEMVELFLQDYPKRVAEIAGAVGRNDSVALEFAAHAVKGAAMTLCAQRVADSALSIEKMGRSSTLHMAGGALVALEQELAEAHVALLALVAPGRIGSLGCDSDTNQSG